MNANDKKELKLLLCEVVDERMEELYIDRERHHNEHMWIQDMMRWSNEIKSSILKCVIKTMVVGIIAVLITGFLVYKGD